MAWSRTLLGIVGVCVLLVRAVWLRTGSGLAITALGPALAAAGITLARQRALAVRRPQAASRTALGIWAVVVAMALATAVLLLTRT